MDNTTTEQGQTQGFDATAAAQLVAAMIAANTVAYPRLQVRLQNVQQAIVSGDQKAAQQQVATLIQFVQGYRPIDKKMGEFLTQYGQAQSGMLEQLQQMVGAPKEPAQKKPQPALKPKLTTKKYGLFRFPFLMYEKLHLGNVAQYKTIFQNDIPQVTFKLWKDINGIPFLVNGYPDDEYSCVTRVLASQLGKLLALQCEEVFFGDLNGKPVTLTAFHEAITLLENQTFKLYKMASNYEYQSVQKQCMYFLIQHWTAYAIHRSQVKERFERHYIDSKGNIYLAQHDAAVFLTPQQMSRTLMVRLTITKDTYRPIRDLVLRVGDRDIADIVFSSIPVEMIEAHDRIAQALNKPLFDQRREALDANWQRLLDSLQEFEGTFGI